VIAAAATLAVLGAVGFGFYMARNQPLFIVNGTDQPVSVSIDSRAAVEVGAKAHLEVAVAEGSHRAVIQQAGEPDDTVEFEVGNGFLERFRGRSAFVLNPAGAAAILWEQVEYVSKNGPQGAPGQPEFRIHAGEKWYTFRDIDYAFRAPPQEIEMDRNAKVTTKTALSIFSEEPLDILLGFPANTPPEVLANYAESQLRSHPDDSTLFEVYVSLRTEANQLDQARAFLAKGLSRRPVEIEWHRTYQTICETAGRQEKLQGQYRKMLDADPKNSALLYLMGRIEYDPEQSRRYFEQAIDADAKNAYPQFALAYDYAAVGDFAKAKAPAEAAFKLRPDHGNMESLCYDVRFALQDYVALEKEAKEQLALEPGDLAAVYRLMQVQAAESEIEKARVTQRDYAEQLVRNDPAEANGHAGRHTLDSKLALLYLEGEMQSILNECSGLGNPQETAGQTFGAQLELGNVAEAEAALGSEEISSDRALLLSLAWSRKGDRAKADQWRKKAIEDLRKAGGRQQQVAALLENGKVDPAELDRLKALPRAKSIWAAAMADACEEHRKELLDYAEKLNTDTYFPHRFLKRTIGEMKAGAK
jgi:hypothetical protein